MSVPRSVVRFRKNGIEYTSSVDRASYTILELSRAAMRDVGKVLIRLVKAELQKQPGMRKHHRVVGRKGMTRKQILAQPPAAIYDVPWVKTGLPHMDIGLTHDTWYGVEQEMGSSRVPKKGVLRKVVFGNIPLIVEIESQYLSALEDEAKALRLISEEDYGGDN